MRVIVLALIAACAATPQPRPIPPIPRYEVKPATSRISIDGKLDDKAWAAAGTIELIFPWESQTGAKQKTTARLLWDDDNLYVSYECEDSDITAQVAERDGPVYNDDAVEIFINPKPSQTNVYLGLEMNVRAVLYDYLHSDGQASFKRFNLQGVRLATNIDGTLNMTGDKDRGWSLEVSIPWANFEELARPPQEGTVWTANLNRWDGTGRNRRLSMWSDPGIDRPSPHVPKRFGELVFVK